VAVRAQVHRHAVDERREVRAVVEVEPAQEILVRLAAAGVLCRDHARHVFDQVPGSQLRSRRELLAPDHALRRADRVAD